MHSLYRDMQLVVVLAMVILVVVDPRVTIATQHVVGGRQGWDTSADFTSWVAGQTFKVRDQLVFRYTPGFHSTVELPGEKEYEKCDMSGALDSMNGGTSVVKLDKPGTRYFTCGTLGHCDQGMKVKIKVVASNESSSTKSPSTASVASSTPASASTSSASPVPVLPLFSWLCLSPLGGWEWFDLFFAMIFEDLMQVFFAKASVSCRLMPWFVE